MAPNSKQKTRSNLGTGAAGVGIGLVAGIAVVGFLRNQSGRARAPYSLSQWRRACAASADGSLPLLEWAELLDIVGEKGCDLDAKREVWAALLGVLPPWVSAAQRSEMRAHLRGSYGALLGACQRKEEELLALVVGGSATAGTSQPMSPGLVTDDDTFAQAMAVGDVPDAAAAALGGLEGDAGGLGRESPLDPPASPTAAAAPERTDFSSAAALTPSTSASVPHASPGVAPQLSGGGWLMDLMGVPGGGEGPEIELSPGRRSGSGVSHRRTGSGLVHRPSFPPVVHGRSGSDVGSRAAQGHSILHSVAHSPSLLSRPPTSLGTGAWGSSATLASDAQGPAADVGTDGRITAPAGQPQDPSTARKGGPDDHTSFYDVKVDAGPLGCKPGSSMPAGVVAAGVDGASAGSGEDPQGPLVDLTSPGQPAYDPLSCTEDAESPGAPCLPGASLMEAEQPAGDGEGPRFMDVEGGGASGFGPAPGMWAEPWAGAMASTAHGGGGLEIPDELRHFWEAQRLIVVDAIRTDFQKHSLTTAEALSSWLSAALVENAIYQKYRPADTDWAKGLWLSSLARSQLDHSSHFNGDQKRQVARLVNLLSAYAIHDPEVGYCQGMSDLALPFLLVMEDDGLAFWCFASLMTKVRRNFLVDDSGIFSQLGALAGLLEAEDATLYYKLRQVGAIDCHFAYRMTVVLMRRELPLEQTLKLWEMLWADDWICCHPAYATRTTRMPRSQSVPLQGPTEPAASQASEPSQAVPSVPTPLANAAAQSSAFGGAAQFAMASTEFPDASVTADRQRAAESLGDAGGGESPLSGAPVNTTGSTSRLWSLSSWGVLRGRSAAAGGGAEGGGEGGTVAPTTASEPPTSPTTPLAAGAASTTNSWLARISARLPGASEADKQQSSTTMFSTDPGIAASSTFSPTPAAGPPSASVGTSPTSVFMSKLKDLKASLTTAAVAANSSIKGRLSGNGAGGGALEPMQEDGQQPSTDEVTAGAQQGTQVDGVEAASTAHTADVREKSSSSGVVPTSDEVTTSGQGTDAVLDPPGLALGSGRHASMEPLAQPSAAEGPPELAPPLASNLAITDLPAGAQRAGSTVPTAGSTSTPTQPPEDAPAAQTGTNTHAGAALQPLARVSADQAAEGHQQQEEETLSHPLQSPPAQAPTDAAQSNATAQSEGVNRQLGTAQATVGSGLSGWEQAQNGPETPVSSGGAQEAVQTPTATSEGPTSPSGPRALFNNLASLFSKSITGQPPQLQQPQVQAQEQGEEQAGWMQKPDGQTAVAAAAALSDAPSASQAEAGPLRDESQEPDPAATSGGIAHVEARAASHRPPIHSASLGNLPQGIAVRWEGNHAAADSSAFDAMEGEDGNEVERDSGDEGQEEQEGPETPAQGSTAAPWGGMGTEEGPSGSGEAQIGLFLYFVTAVVCIMRRKVLDDCHDADDVLRVFQQLASSKLDVAACMRKAREIRERRAARAPAPAEAL